MQSFMNNIGWLYIIYFKHICVRWHTLTLEKHTRASHNRKQMHSDVCTFFTRHGTLPRKCEWSGWMSQWLSHQSAASQSERSVSPWAGMKWEAERRKYWGSVAGRGENRGRCDRKGIKWGCERMGSSFRWLWEILYRWLDLAAPHMCSSAVLLGIIWEDERRKNSFGKILLRSVGRFLTQAGFYWTGCDSSPPTL